MNLVVPFCHGRRSVNIRLSEAPPSFRLGAPKSMPASAKSYNQHSRLATVSIRTQAATASSSTVTRGQRTSTMTCTSRTQASAQTHQSHTSQTGLQTQLENDGLCSVFSCAAASTDCLGTMQEGDHEYAIYPSTEQVFMAQGTPLADLLLPDSRIRLTRVQRYGIALTLASSHLQLHSTPWLKEYWTSEDVLFPTTQPNTAVLHGQPYILAKVEPTPSNAQTPQKDRSFSTLGIVLLELCFGYRLEDHKMWQDPGYAAFKHDPIMRQTVACEWLDDVQGEAGEDYANAVNWTLRQAPAMLRDDKWREEFAQNVVQPLQRYYEYLHPTKIS